MDQKTNEPLDTCCCDTTHTPPVIHYDLDHPFGIKCCLTCLNSPTSIQCKRETQTPTVKKLTKN